MALMDSFFKELGRAVLARWKDENFSLTAFPEIAQTILSERPPSQHVDLNQLIRDFLLDDDQPAQSASGFGQPELIVFEHPRFYIQILFWLDGTTDIHQHEFSGAFHVMEGSSVHSHFAFRNPEPITAHFRLGDLELIDTRLLETGSTVPIVSGGSCIHSLFHLDMPSVTVVIRTQSDPGTGPQFTYLPPHVALDPVQDDALTMRRKQLLDALERLGDPGYLELVLSMINQLDFERGFFILQNAMPHLRGLDAWDEVWEAFAAKHGDLAKKILPTLEEIVRRDGIASLRSSIEWVEHRFFLALLLNVPRRTEILMLVAQRVSGDPIEAILRWAEELTDDSESGTWIVDACFPETVDISKESQPPVFVSALRHYVTGAPLNNDQVPLSERDQSALHDALANSSWRLLALPEF
jgi:hypothetical protein